ncbi:hypothetical protein Plec18170_000933 [Paecilomyces lecythidis]
MTSISQKPGLQPQGQSNTNQAASQTHSPSPSVSGKSSPLAPVPAPASSTGNRTYANATKKVADSTGAQHGNSPSISPVNGKPMQQSQSSGVTIVNGAPAQQPPQGDHSRKPSVTISSAGTSGYIPNGGSAPSRPNSIQFGALNQPGSSSPSMGNPAALANQSPGNLGVAPSMNPRITSPQTSPSPIPQPASSGGRPPSTYQSQGNPVNFGSFGESGDANMRSTPQGPLGPGPQASHLRRESSQSAHSDMSNHMAGGPAGPGRGGYPHQGGRGRGYSQSGYQGQMPYSPGPSFRATPNQPRGGPNMGPQFHGHNQGRPLAPPFPNSPHQANRSPALANSHPVTPQMNQVPMAHPQMQPQHYGYQQHMGPQAVRPQSSYSKTLRYPRKQRNGTRHQPSAAATLNPSSSVNLPPPNLAPESGQFERYLMLMKNQGYPHAYDPSYGYYNAAYGMQPMQYMTPPSPQPRPGMPYNPQAPYIQNQYPAAVPAAAGATPLSRTPSQMSNDRPGSSLGQGAPAGPPGPGHAHSASRTSNSPAPPKNHFIIPPTKKSPLVIKDPGSGAVKTFEKQPASPARGTPSPVKISTPPPRTGSAADSGKSETKQKTDEEKKQELKEAVRRRIEQEEAEQRKNKEEEEARKAMEELSLKEKADKEKAEKEKAEKEQAEKEKAEKEQAEKEKAQKEAAEKEKAEKEAAAAKEAEAKAEESKKAEEKPADDDEIDYDAIERELAEIEAKEAAAEADYYRKKQAEKEEKERKEKEEMEAYERNMKQAEREAEALEEARMKKLEAGDDSKKDVFSSLGKRGESTPGSETPADSGAATPASEASMGPPAKPSGLKRDKPAALKLETTKAVEPPQPSAAMKSLQTARFLDDPSKISYPASVASPNPALNTNAPADRKFKYNKEFLLQFQNVFKEKPSIDWDARVRETVGDSSDSRPQSARTPSMGGRNTSRPGIPQNFQMGTFGQMPGSRQSMPPGTTSEQRFALSNAAARSSMGGNPFGSFGRPGLGMGAPSMSRSGSSSLHGGLPQSPRMSSRGGTRSDSKRSKQASKKEEEAKAMPPVSIKEFKALTSSSGWKPRSVGQAAAATGPAPGGEGLMPPDVVQRKVKANLNKMTPENFDRIAGQILEIVSQSKEESDGRTLRQVIQLLFEKATDEAHWAPMYAKFAKRMLESMSAEIKDESIRDKMGNVVAGGSLFRKYLLNRCQEEFERGWKVNLPPKPEGTSEEAAMMSDEYYAAAAAKRRGLGLVKFIGELYKLGMLTERIMHECVKKLVDYEGIPEEAEVESLASLLRTIGASLDASDKGRTMMDAYFGRITMMMETPGLPSRLRFMLLDIVDLRNARWQSKDGDKGPKTIQEIREEAMRQQQEQEMERIRQQSNRGGRPAIGRGDARGFSSDFRNQAPPPDYASSKVGTDDLRRLKTTRNTNQPMSFGPSSMFGSRSSSGRKNLGPGGNLVRGSDDSAASSRSGTPGAKKEDKEAASSINAFSALAQLEDRDNLATSPPSNPTSPQLTKSRPAVKAPSKEGEGTA